VEGVILLLLLLLLVLLFFCKATYDPIKYYLVPKTRGFAAGAGAGAGASSSGGAATHIKQQ
jgi:hypothetical protein